MENKKLGQGLREEMESEAIFLSLFYLGKKVIEH